jgi:putative peptide maturation dehydrogenase
MRLRRCAIVLVEPRERFDFAFDSIIDGGSGLRATREWIALAAHLPQPVVVSVEEITPLGAISPSEWIERAEADARCGSPLVDALLEKGLLISDDPRHIAARERDDEVRATHWHPYTATVQAFGRWQGVSSGEQVRSIGIVSVANLVEQLGEPPPHFHERVPAAQRIALERSAASPIDDLLRSRATCRNYDTTRTLPRLLMSRILHRVFGAQATQPVTDDVAIVKKTSPSAGGLHPTEAYLLIQRVDELSPGLYHYHVGDHALEPLRLVDVDAAHALAMQFLAHQDWFAAAHVIAILAPRFRRSFWKYREHAKVYRAVTLDVGHLSQTLQISATEFGLGAFVTAAINECDIEQALDLDPMQESPLAVCGFGWRATTCERMEFDPLHAVWPET